MIDGAIVQRARIYLVPCLLIALSVSLSSCALVNFGINSAIALAPLKLLFSCLPEGTAIDTPEGSRPIESLRPGDTIIGFEGRPVKVLQVHGYAEEVTGEEFLEVSFEDGSLVNLCKLHRIDGIRAGKLEVGDVIGSGHIVKSIRSYGGVERSYDLLTEDDGYRVAGVPVNSMITEMYETGRNGGQLKD